MAHLETHQVETDHKQIEQALRDSQARLAGVIASAMDAIITMDHNRHILFFNAAAELMFGYSAGEIFGQPVDILLPRRYRQRHQQHIHRFGETGVTNRTMGRLGTLYGLRANGEEFPIEASISQLEVSEGRLFTVILRDITERVKAEEALIENDQYLRATFEQAAIGIAHVAPDGRYLRVNQRLCEILAYGLEELLVKSFTEITYPEDLDTDLDLQSKLLKGQIPTYSREKRYVRKDGSPVWVNLTVSLVRDLSDNPKYLIEIIEDISKRKEAEAALQARTDEIKTMTQQLWQTAKLATMGELAASIAHELNNPLTILSLRIESLLASVPPANPARRELEVMEQEVDRMASLVANLLQFSRSGQRQISSLDMREEVDRTLELIHNHLLHRHIAVERDYAPVLPLIQADRQQLRQLFLNLFTNASDAMQAGGKLAIRIVPIEENGHILLEISDTGVGIQPDELHQVMEPFYTTKSDGKGTGLGLAICRRIVEEHQGSITISSPGHNGGTLIRIALPGVNQSKPNFLD